MWDKGTWTEHQGDEPLDRWHENRLSPVKLALACTLLHDHEPIHVPTRQTAEGVLGWTKRLYERREEERAGRQNSNAEGWQKVCHHPCQGSTERSTQCRGSLDLKAYRGSRRSEEAIGADAINRRKNSRRGESWRRLIFRANHTKKTHL